MHKFILMSNKMKKYFTILCLLTLSLCLQAQPQFGERPRLVVGIVVDQMRWDYLSRYYEQFTEGGFRRLIDQGYSCNNCLINYVPTITAIGHASIYTGTTPAFHGICGNNFLIDGRKIYCTADSTVQTVGAKGKRGEHSPHNMLSTTIGDQLRLHTDFRSKVVGVSYKDRAAILPAGHSANAVYWLDPKNLCFISSTYYMQELPPYAKEVNAAIAKNKEAQKAGERIGYTPLCGTLTTDMAIAALQGENLGRGEATDMLCVSYSETDVIGHEWGTRGERTDAAYLELDKDLERLFKALDQQVEQGNYLLFLSADHGASHNWKFMNEHHMPAGPIYIEKLQNSIEEYVKAKMRSTKPVVMGINDYRVLLDHKSISEQGLDLQLVKDAIAEYLLTVDGIVTVVDFERARTSAVPQLLLDRILMGYHPRRSGDIIIIPEPQHYSWWDNTVATHTTHGEWNPYDAHIPLLFYGWHISHGATSREVHINDIAPTICQMLHIQQPNACSGEAITEITDK